MNLLQKLKLARLPKQKQYEFLKRLKEKQQKKNNSKERKQTTPTSKVEAVEEQ